MLSVHEALASTTLGPEYSDLLKPPTKASRFTKKLFELYCRGLFSIYCPTHVSGRRNIPTSSCIFCSNHNSHMDSAILMVASGLPFGRFGMVAAADYFFNNRLRKLFLGTLMNLIPVDRDPNYNAVIKLILACREFTKSGLRNIIIFPEGTRSTNGKMQPFKKGPAMVSLELSLPIVPVYITGTREAMPKGRGFMKPTRISATIGRPIYANVTNEGTKTSRNRDYRRLTAELQHSITALREEANGAE